MAYTIYVPGLMEHQRNLATLSAALKDEALELEAYGEPESATFDGDTATVIMSGETDELSEATRSHKQSMSTMQQATRQAGEQGVRAVSLWQTIVAQLSEEEAETNLMVVS